MDILENDLCVRFWRVPFVVLVFTFFVFVSGAWGACTEGDIGESGTMYKVACHKVIVNLWNRMLNVQIRMGTCPG